MEFDKNKILTVVTADQAKVGMIGWFANDIYSLKIYIERGDEPKGLQSVDFHNEYPFRESYPSDGSFACKYRYFYPVPEPTYAERQAQWVKENNVKKGTKVRFIKGFDDSEDGSECCEHEDAKGKEGTVVNITRTYIYVSLGKLGWTAPFTTLEVIKEPTYRPFKNAEEFKPYRDEWFVPIHCSYLRERKIHIVDYCNNGVVMSNHFLLIEYRKTVFYTWNEFFQYFTRENGEPCGVKEEV